MLAGIIAIYLNGALVDVDVLGGAENMAQCKQYAQNTIEREQPKLSKDYELVIKCVPADSLKTMTKEQFEAAPIAAAGFGTEK